jgi:hypothetical protein
MSSVTLSGINPSATHEVAFTQKTTLATNSDELKGSASVEAILARRERAFNELVVADQQMRALIESKLALFPPEDKIPLTEDGQKQYFDQWADGLSNDPLTIYQQLFTEKKLEEALRVLPDKTDYHFAISAFRLFDQGTRLQLRLFSINPEQLEKIHQKAIGATWSYCRKRLTIRSDAYGLIFEGPIKDEYNKNFGKLLREFLSHNS